jgi:2,5-diketo-D-gluconate reductase A
MADTPTVPLRDGGLIPQIGFGVFQVPPEETQRAVETALEVGYRHVDTAAAYGNEAAVGAALTATGLARGEVWVTSKCWNSDHGYDRARAALETTLEKLGTDHLDLYLIHWPVPGQDRYIETWRAFETAKSEGLSTSIGVSNFHVDHLERLLDETDVVPVLNQIELHPWLQQRTLREFHTAHGIATEAWSPIAQGGAHLEDSTLTAIAAAHGVSVAQVILRWHLDLGHVIIPKSVHRERMKANLDLFGFSLDDEDRERIAGLDSGERTGPDPDDFEVGARA